MLEADRALDVQHAAPVLVRLRGKLLDVNGVTRQSDVRPDVNEARPQVGERRGAVGERDLPEQPRLLDVAAEFDVSHDCSAGIHQPRHERADEPHVDAVGANVPLDGVAFQLHPLDDQLRLAAVLKDERVECEEALRENETARCLKAIAIVGIDQHRRAVESHHRGIPAAREISGEIRLDAALTQHRCAEVSGRRRDQRHRGPDAVEADRPERDRVGSENQRAARLFGEVGE